MRPTFSIIVLGGLAALAPMPLLAQPGNFARAGAVAGGDLLIGQPANWYGPGTVYLYRAAAGPWREIARLVAPDSSRGDDFGRSLAVDGGYLVVGAPSKRDSAGAVYLFRRQARPGGRWGPVATFTAEGAAPRSGLGTAVAIQGATAFAGAPGGDSAGVVHQLAVTNGKLVHRATLSGRTLPKGAQLGEAVSVEGDLLLVGAPGVDSGAGAAVLYRRHPDGQWREDAVLSIGRTPGRQPPRTGTAVLLAGGRAFVGAPGADNGQGAVLVYQRDPDARDWRLAGQLASSDSGRGSGFGAALAASGAEVWVGAPAAIDRDGAVYRFRQDPAGSWAPADRIRPDSAGAASWPFEFGSSIAIGGGVAMVGMPQRDFGEGRALVLTRTGGGWRPAATLMGEIFRVGSGLSRRTECAAGKLGPFDCGNIEVMSYLPVDQLGGERGVWVNDVWGWTDPTNGREYALVARRDGAAFVDVTDAERPRLVGTLRRTAGSPPSVWRDIKVYQDHAFIVADGAGAHGMQVFDLTRLRSVTGPKPVAFTEDAHYGRIHSAHNVAADTSSGHVFILGSNGGGETCGGGLHMVDVREPTNPKFAGCYNDKTGARSRGYTHDAQCLRYRGPDERYRGREICLSSNEVELNIADVTDKSRPVPIARSSYPNVGYAHQGWLDDEQRYFYMDDEGDEVAGLVAGTRTLVWDLSRLDDPVLVKEYIGPVQSSDHNLFVKGDRVYLANYGSGLRVLDIRDRANPKEIAFIDTAPVGNNEPGFSATASGAWSNYPFFKSGVVVFTSVREGLFLVRVKPAQLVP